MNSNVLLLLLATLFWGLNFHLGKVMFEYVSPNVAAFWRFLIGTGGVLFLSISSFPPLEKIKNHIGGAALVGFIGLFGFIFFFTQGLHNTSAINGALIVALNPVITLLLTAIFQGYRIKPKDLIGMTVALIGVCYLLTGGNIQQILSIDFALGDIYFLIAVVMFGLQNIWIRKYSTGLGSRPFTLLTNLFCLIGFTVLLPFEAEGTFTPASNRFWLATLGMGLLGTTLSYYFWNLGIKRVGPNKGSIFLNTIPLFVAILAVPFGAELYFFHLVSAALILSGLIIVQVNFRSSSPRS